MAERKAGQWDEEKGYDFDPEHERVPLFPDETDKSGKSSGKPVVRRDMDVEKMHHDFPETHSYLQESLHDIDFIDKTVKSISGPEKRRERDERVNIRRSESRPRKEVGREQLNRNSEFTRRRMRNRAVRRIEEDLRSRGYSDEFIEDNRELIEEKVERFLEE